MLEIKNQESEDQKELKKFQLLLEGPEKEFIDFQKTIAPNSAISRRERKLGKFIEKNELESKFDVTMYSYSELENELKKYNARIVRLDRFTGDFDVNILKEIKPKIQAITTSEYDYSRRTFCIIPYNPSKIDDVEYGADVVNPTLVYMHIKNDNRYFSVVHKGMNYATLYQRYRGLIYSNKYYFGAFHLLYALLAFFTVRIALLQYLPEHNKLITFSIAFVGIVYTLIQFFHAEDKKRSYSQRLLANQI